jgi:hypothetical protein
MKRIPLALIRNCYTNTALAVMAWRINDNIIFFPACVILTMLHDENYEKKGRYK